MRAGRRITLTLLQWDLTAGEHFTQLNLDVSIRLFLRQTPVVATPGQACGQCITA